MEVKSINIDTYNDSLGYFRGFLEVWLFLMLIFYIAIGVVGVRSKMYVHNVKAGKNVDASEKWKKNMSGIIRGLNGHF